MYQISKHFEAYKLCWIESGAIGATTRPTTGQGLSGTHF